MRRIAPRRTIRTMVANEKSPFARASPTTLPRPIRRPTMNEAARMQIKILRGWRVRYGHLRGFDESQSDLYSLPHPAQMAIRQRECHSFLMVLSPEPRPLMASSHGDGRAAVGP